MADGFIGLDVQGLDNLKSLLKDLPEYAQDFVVEDVADYLLNVLRMYPPQKSVTRKAAYGVSFFTDKQRRFFFAALADGSINVPYRRTQALSRGWKKVGSGRNLIIANETPHAGLVMGGQTEQSRHARAIGWKEAGEIAKERADRITKIAEAAAAKAIKKAGG